MAHHDSFLAPIIYKFYSITFPLIPSDDDKIRPTCTHTELSWNPRGAGGGGGGYSYFFFIR